MAASGRHGKVLNNCKIGVRQALNIPFLSSSAQCSPLDKVDYAHLLWTTLAEFPGIMITIATIERFGRKRTMTMEFILLTAALCCLFYCNSNRTLVTAILFVIRAIASGKKGLDGIKWYKYLDFQNL